MPRLIALTILTALLAGCSTAPRVTLGEHVVLTQTTGQATAGHVVVHVENMGAQAIELLEYTYQAHTAGRAYRGRAAGEMVLSPGMVRDVPIPVVLPPEVAAGQQVSVQGTLHYRGTTVWDETLAEWGWQPTVGFSGHPQTAASAE